MIDITYKGKENPPCAIDRNQKKGSTYLLKEKHIKLKVKQQNSNNLVNFSIVENPHINVKKESFVDCEQTLKDEEKENKFNELNDSNFIINLEDQMPEYFNKDGDNVNKISTKKIFVEFENNIKDPNLFKNNQKGKIFILKKIKKLKNWTNEEDEHLKKLAVLYKHKLWTKISQEFTDKSPAQCRARFRRIRPGIIKGTWSKEEDKIINTLVEKYGKSWALISKAMKTRNGKQIRDRYLNYLDPIINKTKFEEYEDNKIIELYKKNGPKWAFISQHFKARTGDMIKNRFHSYLRKKVHINEVNKNHRKLKRCLKFKHKTINENKQKNLLSNLNPTKNKSDIKLHKTNKLFIPPEKDLTIDVCIFTNNGIQSLVKKNSILDEERHHSNNIKRKDHESQSKDNMHIKKMMKNKTFEIKRKCNSHDIMKSQMQNKNNNSKKFSKNNHSKTSKNNDKFDEKSNLENQKINLKNKNIKNMKIKNIDTVNIFDKEFKNSKDNKMLNRKRLFPSSDKNTWKFERFQNNNYIIDKTCLKNGVHNEENLIYNVCSSENGLLVIGKHNQRNTNLILKKPDKDQQIPGNKKKSFFESCKDFPYKNEKNEKTINTNYTGNQDENKKSYFPEYLNYSDVIFKSKKEVKESNNSNKGFIYISKNVKLSKSEVNNPIITFNKKNEAHQITILNSETQIKTAGENSSDKSKEFTLFRNPNENPNKNKHNNEKKIDITQKLLGPQIRIYSFFKSIERLTNGNFNFDTDIVQQVLCSMNFIDAGKFYNELMSVIDIENENGVIAECSRIGIIMINFFNIYNKLYDYQRNYNAKIILNNFMLMSNINELMSKTDWKM